MQSLREHYERQDTEELLEIARKDLTEEARSVLHEVLSKRGLPVKEAEAARSDAVRRQAAQTEADKRLAPPIVRLVAFAIDSLGLGIVLFAVLLPLRIWSEDVHAIAFNIVWWTYFLLRDGIPGQSIGKRLLKIRVVEIESGRSCTWSKSLWRNISHFVFLLDALFVLSHRRMRLGDMIAGTVVVRSAAGRASA
jgi:uncharacterized RDD family membrane protein YckC